jgi:hypothetical protein
MFVRSDFGRRSPYKPHAAAGGAALTRGITRDRSDHSAEPCSRLVNISSHVGSMRIGVPHIRIEDGPRVWEGTVS